MSNSTYIVKQGDTLSGIAKIFYGDPAQSIRIVKANPQIKDPGIISPGQVFIIPEIKNSNVVPDTVEAENQEQITALIDSKNFTFWNNFVVNLSLDTFDTFSLSVPFDPDIQVYRDTFKPFSYKEVSLYLGGEIIFKGILINVNAQVNANSKTITISGYSKPGVLSDCYYPASSYPIEFNNLDLQEIAKISANIFNLETEFESDPGPKFEKVTPGLSEKVFDFLVKLAKQKGLLVSNSLGGKLLFRQTTNTNPVANIKESEFPFISCTPTFNTQNYYSHISGLTNVTAGNDSEIFTEENPFLVNIGVIRPFTFEITDIESANIQNVVKAKMGRMFGDAVSYSLTLQGHRTPLGEIWNANNMLILSAPGVMIYEDTEFIVRRATLSRSAKTGDTTILDLVLPAAYKAEIPEALPWQ